jgi:acyl-CoA reductase-like NAD-dependent aldehyde dehydrogenase
LVQEKDSQFQVEDYEEKSIMSDKSELDLEAILAPMQAVHDSRVNLSPEWRVKQLECIRKILRNHWSEWQEALAQDLGKSITEGTVMELEMTVQEIDLAESQLKKWMAPKQVPTPGLFLPAFTTITPMPKRGPACLIIGPFNYPITLTLKAAIGSLAAGNPTVIKPSEQTPMVSALMKKLFDQYVDKGAVRVVEGSIPETTALLKQPWGLILFTGSERIGKVVAAAASQTLTPTVLELGGKSPCFVDETAPEDIRQIANRIIWAKTINSGQTCTAVDYALVHSSLKEKLFPELLRTLKVQYGSDPETSELGCIVSPTYADRLVDLIKEVEEAAAKPGSSTKILCGGSAKCNPKNRYIAPTIVINPPLDCRLMKEEIFGPILPLLIVESREEAIAIMNKVHVTPLVISVFTKSDRVFQQVCQQVRSGGAMRNDALILAGSSFLPFGGLGTSGYGATGGKYSFDAFSHYFPTIYRPCAPGMDAFMARYHPYAGAKGWLLENVLVCFPVVPVLHTRSMLLVAAVALVCYYVAANGVESWKATLIGLVANVFEEIAVYLRTCSAA